MGYCLAKPRGTYRSFDVDGPGRIHDGFTYEITEARQVCSDFQDTFDWTKLGVANPSWLEGDAK